MAALRAVVVKAKGKRRCRASKAKGRKFRTDSRERWLNRRDAKTLRRKMRNAGRYERRIFYRRKRRIDNARKERFFHMAERYCCPTVLGQPVSGIVKLRGFRSLLRAQKFRLSVSGEVWVWRAKSILATGIPGHDSRGCRGGCHVDSG